jgi:ribulose-phosphate 3-epimerase
MPNTSRSRGTELEIGNWILEILMEIIPAIIAKDFDELRKKIESVESFVKTVQLDVMDGIFVPNTTWPYTNKEPFSVGDIDREPFSVNLEAHLMVSTPQAVLGEWFSSKIKRIIVHWETVGAINNKQSTINNLVGEARKSGKEFGIALNPETPVEVLEPYIKDLDLVLLMSVNPGAAGQEFQESVIPKISALRSNYPDVKIGVDGGVNLENAKGLKEAGVDFLVVGSAIFANKNIERSIEEFKKIIK